MIVQHFRSVPETNSSSSHFIIFGKNYKREFPVLLKKVERSFLDYGDVLSNPEDIVCYMYSQAFYNNVSDEFRDRILKRPEIKTLKNFNLKTFTIDHQSIIYLKGKKDFIADFLVDFCLDILRHGEIVIEHDSNIISSEIEFGEIYDMYIYKNGNTYTLIERSRYNYEIFKKYIIRFNNDPENIFVYPNQIDIKITNNCEYGCWFCHEKSSPSGKHANYSDIILLLYTSYGNMIPEICLGGGNVLLYPYLCELILSIIDNDSFVSFSVNWKDVFDDRLINILDIDHYRISLGISMGTFPFNDNKTISKFLSRLDKIINNFIFHFIDGVNTTKQIKSFYKKLKEKDMIKPMLVLGFKLNGHKKTIDIKELAKKYIVYVDEIFVENHGIDIIGSKYQSINKTNLMRNNYDNEQNKLFVIDFSDYLYIDVVEKKFYRNSAYPKELMPSYNTGMSIEYLFKTIKNNT